jgi:hypothetical protein
MKIALATTTIHVPHALKLMRKCDPNVRFFVAMDEKTPFQAIASWDGTDSRDPRRDTPMSNTEWLAPVHQKKWKCSEAIGWNTLARRNIAFLEALKWGADVIYSWDNDNIPVDLDHFTQLEVLGGMLYDGVKVGNYHWFDPGSLLIPHTRHRGFPYDMPHRNKAEPVINAKVGVAAGLVIGDPDIDAVTRMEHRPDIGSVHILGSTGVVVDPHTWTVFNSQNTAVVRELIPAWFMMPNVGRHDDIYASLIVQRVARERDLHVHFGPPFTYQQRNEHNLIKDLRAEIDGMENVAKVAHLLNSIILPGKSVIEDTRIIYQQLCHCAFIPRASAQAGLLWLTDCEGVL